MRLRVISAVVLLLTAALTGCTVPLRGELGISVDAHGRLIGVIAACPDQHLEYLQLLDLTQRGVQVTLTPTGDDRPQSIVLSDPGDGWTDNWPENPTCGKDPRKLTAHHEYAMNGRTAGVGLFASGSILFGVNARTSTAVPTRWHHCRTTAARTRSARRGRRHGEVSGPVPWEHEERNLHPPAVRVRTLERERPGARCRAL
jgi:hypothetical protein